MSLQLIRWMLLGTRAMILSDVDASTDWWHIRYVWTQLARNEQGDDLHVDSGFGAGAAGTSACNQRQKEMKSL